MKWIRAVFLMEIKKLLSYRVEFWLQFIGLLIAQVVAAYFLWDTIYTHKGVEKIGGYTFSMMMVYYVLVPFVDRISQTGSGPGVSSEIYSGSLNRFLLYPISYFTYKYASRMAFSVLAIFQMIGLFVLFRYTTGIPSELGISMSSIGMGIVACLAAGLLSFFLCLLIELIAFWVDSVWTFLLLLKTATYFFGGGMIPLHLFPQWSQPILESLPFHLMLSFPVRTLMGEVTLVEWAGGIASCLLWSLIASLGIRFVWKSGERTYAGVGI